MARKRTATKLHLLTTRQVQAAGDGDLSDGGGLIFRVREQSSSWVYRYTAQSGKRREMGLGPARRRWGGGGGHFAARLREHRPAGA